MKHTLAILLTALSLQVEAAPNKYRLCRDISDHVANISDLRQKFGSSTDPKVMEDVAAINAGIAANPLQQVSLDAYEAATTRQWTKAFERCIDYLDGER